MINYQHKYNKYKNKYLMLKKQLGAGIEEYDDQTKPVLQSLFTNLDNVCKYYHTHNPVLKKCD
jgi:hypothetical protein